jgi:hypothetical protein
MKKAGHKVKVDGFGAYVLRGFQCNLSARLDGEPTAALFFHQKSHWFEALTLDDLRDLHAVVSKVIADCKVNKHLFI